MSAGAFVLVLSVLAASSCSPGLGPLALPATDGQVIDRNTGEPIADALVIEWVRERSISDASRPVRHARTTRTGPDGRFAFAALGPGSPPRYPPTYDFFHGSYGWIRGGAAQDGRVDLAGSVRDSALRLLDVAAVCQGAGREDDVGHRSLREAACPVGDPGRWPGGSVRASGERDDRGRRHGRWEFFRADGTLLASGDYEHGAARGKWVYHSQ